MRQKVNTRITREEQNIIEALHRVEVKVKELTGKNNIDVVVMGEVRNTKISKSGLRYKSEQKKRSQRIINNRKEVEHDR